MWSLSRPKEALSGRSRLHLSAQFTAATAGALALLCTPLTAATAHAEPTEQRPSAVEAAPMTDEGGLCVPGYCPDTFPPVSVDAHDYLGGVLNPHQHKPHDEPPRKPHVKPHEKPGKPHDKPGKPGKPKKKRGPVKVVKTDKKTGKPLAGAVFELWRESNDTAGLQTEGMNPDTRAGELCTTDDQGVCRRTVATGTYYWRETKAPAGYKLPSPTVFGPLELTKGNHEKGVTVKAANARKTPPEPQPKPKGKLHVVKVDKTTKKPLQGAVFQLWRETNGRAGLQTSGSSKDTRIGRGCATDTRGRCGFKDLKLGSYYLQETDVPDGYQLPAKPVSGPYKVTKENASKGVTVRLSNKRGGPGKG
ncbi:MSCRAMM family protein [Streptomyces luteolus]|uniref:SpaA isopeptide-forming pilin-related protein n=1 Tax=Streptomyces luteolus TaxID=3043615 RepID=A0ABT6T4D6_9ACTN|nr:SpaA isopeptide-forming pilin-related protein [Streptomyces sp. B-S-A12]MDI3422726.1 SpaA isopeptide-forming pilin-related protein [Streptomyces sp. B-S-A12]